AWKARTTSQCQGANLGDTFLAESFMSSSLPGGSYTAELAKAYQARTAWEATEDGNWMDATAFMNKGKAAAAGEEVMPWDPAQFGLSGDVVTGYQSTLSALQYKDVRPAACARMVATYDHWVEEASEGSHSITPAGQMQGEWASARFECTGGVAPLANVSKSWVVYFGFDRTNLSSQARSIISEVVAAVSGGTPNLSIVGHADTVGSVSYNQGLSERRANRVANALAAAGVDLGRTQRAGRSENELAVRTGDNVREPLNRRVEIQLAE
ncbi:MAG: OmpA family protein, partial [Pseudomonadota bacterium]